MKRALLAGGVLAVWIGATQFSAATINDVHFHHFHLNVVDPQRSSTFYQQIFGGVPVKFAGRTDAIFTERSFILFNKVAQPAAWALETGIWHLGWGGVDGPREFNILTGKGVEFQTPVTALGNNYYMYAFGPDKEVLEVWTGFQNHRYGHIHLVAADTNATLKWYSDTLGIALRPPAANGNVALQQVDNVAINALRQPATTPVPALWEGNAPITAFQPTKGRAIDHIAFSYRKIQPIFDRMKKAGVTIAEPITVKQEFGFKSFFITGPENVLIEIVEAKPIPDASWEEK